MALTLPAVTSTSCRIMLFKRLPSQLHRPLNRHVWTRPVSASFSVKSSATGSFSEPPKLKAHVKYVVKKLHEFTPDSVHNFPWKKAESIALQQLLVLGQEALKWSLPVLFILCLVSDILYSVARNKELLIPFGLFYGCMTADFLRETSKEFFPNSKERGWTWLFFGIGCFFVLVRIIAVYFSDRNAFLLHAANGGLMQVLWQWKRLSPIEVENINVILEDASITSNAEN